MSAVESHRRWDCFRILFEGPIGALDLDKTWWVYDELDQLAGTLALSDPNFAQYLPRAYDYLTDVLARIVNGHPNRDIDQLLPWAYRKQDLKAVA